MIGHFLMFKMILHIQEILTIAVPEIPNGRVLSEWSDMHFLKVPVINMTVLTTTATMMFMYNPNLAFSAPKFEASDFDTVIYDIGDQVVVINDDYTRSLVTITSDPQVIHTRGATITIEPGVTKLIEGNTVDEFYNINPNVYDGIDNDLDGLIDENFIYHYRQIRMKQEPDKYDVDKDGDVDELINVILYDVLNPVCYIDYFTGMGENDPLIDEKRNDGIDNDGDWNIDFDDVGADGKDYTNDYGEGDGLPTPGEPNFDATDVDESDQIGLSSFNYFTPSNEYPMDDDDELWDWLKPGYFDLPTNIQGR